MLLLEPICQLTIVTKEGEKLRLGDVISPVQVDFIRRCEDQLFKYGRIRVIVLKARQMGLSTIVEAILYILAVYNAYFEALVVSHEKDSAAGILKMTKRYWETYPFAPFHTEEYSGRTYLSWSDIGSAIQVATARNTGAGRSRTLRGLHASEVAFWPDGDTLMGGLLKSIPARGLSAVFLESTANGVGNYFHQQWLDARAKVNEYEGIFYPWHAHPWYTIEYLSPDVQVQYDDLGELDEEEVRIKKRFRLTDGQLRWRRWAIANECHGDVNNFHQEYPCDPTEAFLSTGTNVFNAAKLIRHYQPRHGAVGRLVRRGTRIEFVEAADGPLRMFWKPSDDRDWGMYRIGADPTHTQVHDWACAQVINRRTLEQVAVLRVKEDPIKFAEQLYLLGMYYNVARLVPEKTGPGYATIGALAAMNYPDIWASQKLDSLPGAPLGLQMGWQTNVSTKPLAIGHLQYVISQDLVTIGGEVHGLVIHDEMTYTEARDYVFDPKTQRYRNGRGSEYDDGVMALAIAVATEALDGDLPAYGGYDPSTPSRQVVQTAAPRPARASGSGTDPATSAHQQQQLATRAPEPATTLTLDQAVGGVAVADQEQRAPWEDWDT